MVDCSCSGTRPPPQIPEGFVDVAQDTDVSNTDLLCPAFHESPLVEYVGTYLVQPPLSIAEELEIPWFDSMFTFDDF